jgi:hypothetical protein
MATTIIQAPDSLSYSVNLKKIIASSTADISVKLEMGSTEIFDLVYSPGIGGTIEVDLWRIADKLLTIGIPTNNNILTEQTFGVADFTATVDTEVINFRVIKGGVLDIQSQAHDFVDAHLLSWQPQGKKILQVAPEWLGVYATAERKIKVKAYFLDETTETILLASAAADKLYSVNVSWASVNEALTKKNPLVWDVWTEDSTGTRLSFIQRYILRNASDEENLYIWCNTLGGIDSFSMTGYLEDDEKLEHKISELIDQTLDEYDIDKKREIRQSTGYITLDESRWLKDFFLSPVRYQVRKDGSVKRIVVVESKVASSSADDQHEYEFTFRYADDPALLNLDKTLDPLPAPEVPGDFFLTELLSGLTTAQYQDNLLLAVQSPFAQGWQKLSFAQLWEMAMPTLVDNKTVVFINGKLQSFGAASTNATIIEFTNLQYPEITEYDLHHAEIYGPWPMLRIFTVDADNSLPDQVPPRLVLLERYEKPTFQIDDNKLQKITWDLSREETGYIILN